VFRRVRAVGTSASEASDARRGRLIAGQGLPSRFADPYGFGPALCTGPEARAGRAAEVMVFASESVEIIPRRHRAQGVRA